MYNDFGDVMKKPELLAPAGNMESLRAAVLGGADAVYLGGYTFGARSFAGNFSNEEIIEAVKYCHLRKVKVYVTVNTLIHEDRFDMCISYIDFLHRNNVDAIIVQDLGLMDYVRKVYPNLEIHASTQMHIHNLEGVKFVEELGLSRAVLARETSIETIEEIKKNSSIELEIFVHGALCVSYSGQCLMSSLIGGRSGNLGNCSQCCRMKYDFISDGKVINRDKYPLSTKDLNTLNNIGALIDIGVDSLKIEGRMKRPEYVYMVTRLYRKAIDNYVLYGDTKITDKDIDELMLLFNRKFTKGFLFNELNTNFTHSYRPNHMGVNLGKVVEVNNNKVSILLERDLSVGDGIRILGNNEDTGTTVTKMFVNNKEVKEAKSGDIVLIYIDGYVSLSSKVLKTTNSKQLLEIKELMKSDKLFSITGEAYIEIGKPIAFTVHDEDYSVTVTSEEVVEGALNSPTTRDRIETQLKKFGGTIYDLDNITIEMKSEDVFIPITVLNELRRKVVGKLDNHRLYQITYQKCEYSVQVPSFQQEKNMSILISTEEHYKEIENKNFSTVYTENTDLYGVDKEIVIRLPRVINHFYEYSTPLLIGEFGSLRKYSSNKLYTDFSFNVVNSYTLAFLHSLGVERVTLSYELTKDEIESIITNYKNRYGVSPNVEVIVSSRPEVMISKFDLVKYYGCSGHDNYLKDSFGNLFPVKSDDDFMRIYHYKLLEDDDYSSYFDIGVNSVRIHRSI